MIDGIQDVLMINYQQSKISHLWKHFGKFVKVEILFPRFCKVDDYGLNCICCLRFWKRRLGDLHSQMIRILELLKFFHMYIPPPIWWAQSQIKIKIKMVKCTSYYITIWHLRFCGEKEKFKWKCNRIGVWVCF